MLRDARVGRKLIGVRHILRQTSLKVAILFFAAIMAVLFVATSCGSVVVTTPPEAALPAVNFLTLEEALKNGKPTLAEFGSDSCIPCRAMRVVLRDLVIQYEGKLNVAFIDVYQEKELANQYGIMAIPTQVFFDRSGKSLTQHVGFFPEEEIIAALEKLGMTE